MHVLLESMPLLVFCHLGVVVDAEVDCSLEDCVWSEIAVGFGDDASVDASWGV